MNEHTCPHITQSQGVALVQGAPPCPLRDTLLALVGTLAVTIGLSRPHVAVWRAGFVLSLHGSSGAIPKGLKLAFNMHLGWQAPWEPGKREVYLQSLQ